MTKADWLSLVAPLLQAISIAVTAVFAVRGLSAWRRQLLGKRKFEAAEEILLITYKLQRGLHFVRNPLVLDREGAPDAPDHDFAPLNRMNMMRDDLAAFSRARLVARVFFGPSAVAPFDAILSVYNDVALAAGFLLVALREPLPEDERERKEEIDRRAEWKLTVWGRGRADRDALVERVDAAVNQIEGLCRPALSD